MEGSLKPAVKGRRRIGLTLAAAASVAVLSMVALPATFGLFSAHTENPGNAFAAGTLTMTNSKNNALIVTASNIKPGDVNSGSVTITNSGSLPATMTLSQSNIGGTLGLQSQLQLEIKDGSTVIYSGAFNALSATVVDGVGGSGSQWAASEAHTFAFKVTFPSTSDNSYQGGTASAQFDWDSAQ